MPRKNNPSDDDNLEFQLENSASQESAPETSDENSEGRDIFDPGDGHVDKMFSEWFLDYASYVILERAVPHANDGLKPVQRRILHSMRELEDGRYNKVANVTATP